MLPLKNNFFQSCFDRQKSAINEILNYLSFEAIISLFIALRGF